MFYTKEMFLDAINERGYNGQLQVVTKNGVEMNSVVFKKEDSCTAPNIYIDEVLDAINEGKVDFEVAVNRVIVQYEEHKDVSFDLEVLKDKEYFLEHTYIALQRAGEEPLVKRECGFEGVEAYLYIRVDVDNEGMSSIKLNNKILELVGLAEEEVWKAAERNTFAETTVKPIFSAISDMLDTDLDEEFLEEVSDGLFVFSNKSMNCGASAILDKKALKKFADMVNATKFFVLPSSRHEIIVVPDRGNMSLDSLTELVQTVNMSEVNPVDQLADRAFEIAI